jgi:DNA-binding transcriptional LysR family regulator
MDLRGIDLNLLVSLDILLQERNVTKAAERLHLSQPALSAQLARLRQLLDDPLLVPSGTGRGMIPTAHALELMHPLRSVLEAMEAVVSRRPRFDPMASARSFAIGASDSATTLIGIRLVERLKTAAGPGIRLAFQTPEKSRLADQLESGELDMLITSDHTIPPGMSSHKLFTEHFVMAQRKGHPRGTAPLDLDAYCGLRHLLVSLSGGGFTGVMDEALAKLGRERTVALSVQQFTLAPAILQSTDYVSTLPSRCVGCFADRLDAFELPFASPQFALLLAWHPRNDSDPGNQWLRGHLLEVACEELG